MSRIDCPLSTVLACMIMAGTIFGLGWVSQASADPWTNLVISDGSDLDRLRARLDRGQAEPAARELVALLARQSDPEVRRQLSELLLRAYREAAEQARSQGQTAHAETLRINALLIEKRLGLPQASTSSPDPQAEKVESKPEPSTQPQFPPPAKSDAPPQPIAAPPQPIDAPPIASTEQVGDSARLDSPGQPEALDGELGIDSSTAAESRPGAKSESAKSAVDPLSQLVQAIGKDLQSLPSLDRGEPTGPSSSVPDAKPGPSAESPDEPRSVPVRIPGRDVQVTPVNNPETPDVQSAKSQSIREDQAILAQADQAYLEGRQARAAKDQQRADSAFGQADRLYQTLAERGALPEGRRIHWWYCRCYVHVLNLNAEPQTADDWQRILADATHLRQLNPDHYFSEYLFNRTADLAGVKRTQAARSSPRPLVIRGAAPERGRQPVRPVAQPSPGALPRSFDPSAPIPGSAPGSTLTTVGQRGPDVGGWQTWVAEGIRVLHRDRQALAQEVAKVALQTRQEQFARLDGRSNLPRWTPACDLILHADGAGFAKATGLDPKAQGVTTIKTRAGRVDMRRIDLRADGSALLTSVVPHEVTHVVIADLFPNQPLPPWVDEGIAATAEPTKAQDRYLTQFAEARRRGQVVPMAELLQQLNSASPASSEDDAHFIQGFALVRNLMARDTPQTFIRFLRLAQQRGVDDALSQIYGIQAQAANR